MAAYNRLPLLKKALGSALGQQHESFEVLVVDDGSEDETRQYLQLMAEQEGRLRLFFNNHAGVAVARASGVRESRGDIIVILDSDDLMVADALAQIESTFAADPELVMTYCNIREKRPNGSVVTVSYPVYESPDAMLMATLCRPRVPFKHSGTAFRRDLMIAMGSYDEGLPARIDIDLFLKVLSHHHKPWLIKEPLVEFLMHSDSVSSNRSLGLKVWFLLIDRYGPRNPIIRTGIKLWRAAAELFKSIYVRFPR